MKSHMRDAFKTRLMKREVYRKGESRVWLNENEK